MKRDNFYMYIRLRLYRIKEKVKPIFVKLVNLINTNRYKNRRKREIKSDASQKRDKFFTPIIQDFISGMLMLVLSGSVLFARFIKNIIVLFDTLVIELLGIIGPVLFK